MIPAIAARVSALEKDAVAGSDGTVTLAQVQSLFQRCNARLQRADDSAKRARKVLKSIAKRRADAAAGGGESGLSATEATVLELEDWLRRKFSDKPAVLRSFRDALVI